MRGDISKTVVLGAFKKGNKFSIKPREPSRKYFGSQMTQEVKADTNNLSSSFKLSSHSKFSHRFESDSEQTHQKIIPEYTEDHDWVTKLDLKSSTILSIRSNESYFTLT